MCRWSPDGNWIAFLRQGDGDSGAVYVVPGGGGLERKLGDASTFFSGYGQGLDWSPDGKWLAITKRASPESQPGLALLSYETGQHPANYLSGRSAGGYTAGLCTRRSRACIREIRHSRVRRA